jgi:hypothetical protein
MFVTLNIPALFKKGTLKLIPSDDGQSLRRVAEATLVVEPFPASLAHELGEDIAGHLFDDANAIRVELEKINLRVRCGLQNVTVAHHEELAPVAKLSPVSIKDVSVARIEDKKMGRAWLSLSFVLVFSLEDKTARDFVLDEFGRTLFWTFAGMQDGLLEKAEIHDALARLGDPSGDGSTKASFGIAGGEMHEIDPEAHKAEAERLRKKAGRTH